MNFGISIHAPRVGGDESEHRREGRHEYFNPRPPCGGRRLFTFTVTSPCLFQSTPPVWGATCNEGRRTELAGISIHAPRVGGDSKNS